MNKFRVFLSHSMHASILVAYLITMMTQALFVALGLNDFEIIRDSVVSIIPAIIGGFLINTNLKVRREKGVFEK